MLLLTAVIPREENGESILHVWWLHKPMDGVKYTKVTGQRMFCLLRKFSTVVLFFMAKKVGHMVRVGEDALFFIELKELGHS